MLGSSATSAALVLFLLVLLARTHFCVAAGPSWVIVKCTNETETPMTCSCERASRSEIQCSFQPGKVVPHSRLACDRVDPTRLSALSINCADCGVLSLSRMVYRSSMLRLEASRCELDGSDAYPMGATSVTLIGDGDVGISGAAGFFSSATNRLAGSSCSLRRLSITDTELRFPSALFYNCPSLSFVNITDSRLQDLSDEDVLALSSGSKEVHVTGCELFYFGDGLVSQALEQLNRQPLREFCPGTGPDCKKFTAQAKFVIDLMVQSHGAVSDARVLYYMMDYYGVRFRMLVGQKVGQRHAAGPLSTLDLSNNRLTVIPSSLSMLANLETLNLSWNQISNLYAVSGCWGGPASMIVPKNRTIMQCYWFRAARRSLKTLDLSHNLIAYLGELEPWYEVSLRVLDLSYNRIAVLNTDAFSASLTGSLIYLYLDNNYVKKMTLNNLAAVQRIRLQNNQLYCIKNDTLPRSVVMTTIDASNNQITSIASDVFKEYPTLRELDLSGNIMEYLPFASFETSPRNAKSDRVTLHINQRVQTVCDCRHFFARTLGEEQSDDTVYKFPALTSADRENIRCRLIPRNGAKSYNSSKELKSLQPDEFGCLFFDYSNIELPEDICIRPSGINCIGRCNSGCHCWANNRVMIMNCSVNGIPLSAKNIAVPVTKLDFSYVTTSFFQALSNDTFTWKFESDKSSLRELHAVGSNIVSIEDYTFTKMNGLTKLYFANNRIKRLTRHTFAGLENTLTSLTLEHNNLSTISTSRVLQPLGALSRVTLYGNPFVCSCDAIHLNYLMEMAEYCSAKSVIRDYSSLSCKLTSSFVDDFKRYNLSSTYTNFSVPYFPMDSVELLKVICSDIEDRKAQFMMSILKTSLITLGIVITLVATVLLVRRRHFISSVLFFIVLSRLITRRPRVTSTRDYHLFVYCADGNTDVLADVLDTLAKTCEKLVGRQIRVSTAFNFAMDSMSLQNLNTFESIELGVEQSSKVMVILSEELFRVKTFELTTIVNALGDYRLSRDLILMRLEQKEELENQLLGSIDSIGSREEREGLKLWMRILFSNQTVLFGSVDWEYKLINLVFKKKSPTPFETNDSEHSRILNSFTQKFGSIQSNALSTETSI